MTLEPTAGPPDDAARPERIGGYRIVDVLGEGGMGTVYLAEQHEPVRRRVALKVIKLGMDSKQVLARFEAERQALAMMSHDHIAKVFDAGTTERGQPYFAMEHVPGLSITEHCDTNKLTIDERLALFRKVCAGVQHAHQKGVIHRDLKPSNVLVTLEQGDAVPKIIDFGLARATDHRLLEATLYTEQGVVVGTPEYTSPEQADPTIQDIDTRTDVYSLGVLLYELLVGALPFGRRELRQAGLLEIRRKIREDDPPKPSTKLTSLGGDSEHIAVQRRTNPARLSRALRGDLDWIVMRAMEKDRSRRYETAAALAEDIGRHLTHEPVDASPPSASYRLRKLVRRYRGRVTAATIVFAVLVAGSVASAIESARAKENAHRATNSARLAQTRADELEQKRSALATRTGQFDQLANVVKLERVRETGKLLVPAWPHRAPALRRWLEEDWVPLERALPGLRRTVAALRARAIPLDAEQQLELASAIRTEVDPLRRQLAQLRRAAAVRAGEAQPQEWVLDESERGGSTALLHFLAQDRVIPVRRRVFGELAKGLAAARLAVARIEGGDTTIALHKARLTLAWALFESGLDAAALEQANEALALAPRDEQEYYREVLQELGTAIDRAQGESGRDAIIAVEREIARRRTRIDEGWERQFEAASDRFLYETLGKVARDIEAFEAAEVATNRESLAWAEKIERLSIVDRADRWQEARIAIGKADDVVASARYRAVPVDLQPQVGLVPIGMNPTTKLWEFYHLRSAVEPSRIPQHDARGSIPVDGDTGIVFVLLPGGSFSMGAQRTDPNSANYDAAAGEWEAPVHTVSLAPYFLARHELTQGQWQRLVGPQEDPVPSLFRHGNYMRGMRTPLTQGRAHPVEQVDWRDSNAVLRRHGLVLPTSAQWEYACRAGTTTPWFSGDTADSLHGFANILDVHAAANVPAWGTSKAADDGFIVHAPVGRFRANDWGLFDLHGNVAEWCLDGGGHHDRPVRAGDGFRELSAKEARSRVIRGGTFGHSAMAARSAAESFFGPGTRHPVVGLRAVRAVLD